MQRHGSVLIAAALGVVLGAVVWPGWNGGRSSSEQALPESRPGAAGARPSRLAHGSSAEADPASSGAPASQRDHGPEPIVEAEAGATGERPMPVESPTEATPDARSAAWAASRLRVSFYPSRLPVWVRLRIFDTSREEERLVRESGPNIARESWILMSTLPPEGVYDLVLVTGDDEIGAVRDVHIERDTDLVSVRVPLAAGGKLRVDAGDAGRELSVWRAGEIVHWELLGPGETWTGVVPPGLVTVRADPGREIHVSVREGETSVVDLGERRDSDR